MALHDGPNRYPVRLEVTLLRHALKTFARRVPLDIVRQLVESGQSLGLGACHRWDTPWCSAGSVN